MKAVRGIEESIVRASEMLVHSSPVQKYTPKQEEYFRIHGIVEAIDKEEYIYFIRELFRIAAEQVIDKKQYD